MVPGNMKAMLLASDEIAKETNGNYKTVRQNDKVYGEINKQLQEYFLGK